MVVISILAIIAGIGVGAYFLIMGGQKQDASKTATARGPSLLATESLSRVPSAFCAVRSYDMVACARKAGARDDEY